MIDPIELHSLADGELTTERKRDLNLLIAESPVVKLQLESILQVKALLRKSIVPIDCEGQWRSCVARLNELDRVHRIEKVVSGRLAWGLSGIFFAAIIIAGTLHKGPSSSNMNSADLAWMVGSFKSHDSAPVSSEGTSRVADELFKLAQISIDPKRMSVRDIRYGELDGRPVTKFNLRDASGDLALLVVPDVMQLEGIGEMRADHSLKLSHIGPINCVSWTDGRNTLVLIGDRPFEDLATTASVFVIR